MIRTTWLQFRTQAAVAVAALVGVGLYSAITGPHLADLYDQAVASCSAGGCSVAGVFPHGDTTLRTWFGLGVVVLPAVLGIFWGAPLVAREIETGTFRLVWTQSVTRTRWVAVKLAVVGLTGTALAGLVSLVVTGWAGPIDRADADRFATFDQRDLVPVGYAAFALALGVTAGLLIRRTVPAMAGAGTAFIAVRLAFVNLVRPHLLTTAHRELALDPDSTGYGSSGSVLFGSHTATLDPGTPHIPNAWIISSRVVDHAGHSLPSQVLAATCPDIGGRPGQAGAREHGPVPATVAQTLHDCVTKIGVSYHQTVTFLPADRYWPLQWCETAIFLGAALALAALCLWQIHRRLS